MDKKEQQIRLDEFNRANLGACNKTMADRDTYFYKRKQELSSPVEPEVSDDFGRKFIEKAYLYRCNYIRDVENWEGGYGYLMADSLEEAYELAKILYDKENGCVIDIRYIKSKKKGDIYGCYILAQNSR